MSSEQDNTTTWVDFWPDFLAGSVAGSSGIFIGHPLDTIKVRKQSSFKFPSQTLLFTHAETGSITKRIRVLYRGLTLPMISEGVRQSIFFGCYGLTLKHLDKLRKEGHWYNQGNLNDKQKKYIDIIIASIVGGTIQSFLATPVEQFKVIQQAQRSYTNVIGSKEFLRSAFKSRFFFRDCAQTLLITIMRESSSYAVYMTSYVWMMNKINEKMEEYKDEKKGRFTNRRMNDFCNSMFSGGMAGVVSWLLNMPIDNIKTRLQVEFCSASPRYTGIRDCFVKVCSQEGFRSFWNGWGVVCLRAFPVNAVTLTVYTYSLNWFNFIYYSYFA